MKERLTEKDYCGYDIKNRKLENDYTDEEVFNALQKLGQLEDDEEELGFELTILLKGAYNGIRFIYPYDNTKEILFGYIDLKNVDKMEHSFLVDCNYGKPCLSFYDYGEKKPGGWALTKEELE